MCVCKHVRNKRENMSFREGQRKRKRDETAAATERNPNLGHSKLTFPFQLPLCSSPYSIIYFILTRNGAREAASAEDFLILTLTCAWIHQRPHSLFLCPSIISVFFPLQLPSSSPLLSLLPPCCQLRSAALSIFLSQQVTNSSLEVVPSSLNMMSLFLKPGRVVAGI